MWPLASEDKTFLLASKAEMSSPLARVLRTQVDFLLFRPIAPNLRSEFSHYLGYIVLVALVVGAGRYWDHPAAAQWQRLGLGSLIYVLVLTAFLWLVLKPLRPSNWEFKTVFVFVGLTALPGLLYAVPVERFLPIDTARAVNAWFLGAVAALRVALFVRFLRRVARFDLLRTLVGVLLPLSAIVVSLAALNLEHVVFDLMAGIREEHGTAHGTAYLVVVILTTFALLAFPVTLFLYLAAIVQERRRSHGRMREGESIFEQDLLESFWDSKPSRERSNVQGSRFQKDPETDRSDPTDGGADK